MPNEDTSSPSRRSADTPEAAGVDPARLEALFERAQREVREGLLPSCQLAVARRGRLVATRAYGTVRHEGGPDVPATIDTLYTIFSCTKAITSAAAWLLIQEGKLGIDERVADILPEFARNGMDAVTVEQLFVHTAGFPTAPSGPRDWADGIDRRALRDRIARWRLNWEPGTRFEYHPSSSMWVIALLIEARSGVPYQEFVRTRICEPTGLSDLHVGLPRELDARVADIEYRGVELTEEDYRERGWPIPPETEVSEPNIMRFNAYEVRRVGVPGGGGITCAAELALFYQTLIDGRAADGTQIWTPETLRMARQIRSRDLRDPLFHKRANRALGVVIAGGEERAWIGFGRTGSAEMFGHGGAGGQIAWADPVTGLSFAYCTNGFDRDRMRMGRRGVGLSSRAAACVIESA